jgi:hypothetical protein
MTWLNNHGSGRERKWGKAFGGLFFLGCGLAASLWALSAALAQSTGVKQLALLTAAEADKLRMATDEWPRIRRTRGVSVGPQVVIDRPGVRETREGDTIELATPGTLLIHFEPSRAPVSMDTLRVRARKGFFTKSLTELLRPYVRGTTLQVSELSVPEGRYLIELQIADTNGAETAASYRLLVNAR